MYFLSGKRSGILMRRKSWMHFSSSCSGVIFSLLAFLFAASRSRTPKVLTRSMSVLRRISACCSMWTCPLGMGRSSVWMLGCRLTGPQITVPWGEPASDWVSEQEVERSLKEVPLSPSRSLLWLLQQQSQWEDDHLEGPPRRHTKPNACSVVLTTCSKCSVAAWPNVPAVHMVTDSTSNQKKQLYWSSKCWQMPTQQFQCHTNIFKQMSDESVWWCVCGYLDVGTCKSLALTFNCWIWRSWWAVHIASSDKEDPRA